MWSFLRVLVDFRVIPDIFFAVPVGWITIAFPEFPVKKLKVFLCHEKYFGQIIFVRGQQPVQALPVLGRELLPVIKAPELQLVVQELYSIMFSKQAFFAALEKKISIDRASSQKVLCSHW